VAKVVLARRARPQLLDLDWPLIDAVEGALGLLERDPDIGHALRGRLHGLRSLRAGSYRIIYQLAEDDQTVRVVALRHRSIAYRTNPR
jgi:mRNA interferase RelE/StbE